MKIENEIADDSIFCTIKKRFFLHCRVWCGYSCWVQVKSLNKLSLNLKWKTIFIKHGVISLQDSFFNENWNAPKEEEKILEKKGFVKYLLIFFLNWQKMINFGIALVSVCWNTSLERKKKNNLVTLLRKCIVFRL